MLSVHARPGLAEQYGCAVSVGRTSGDLIGAMGDVAMLLDAGARDEAGRIAAELGPLLWRIRYGKSDAAREHAVSKFAAWLRLVKPWAAEIENVDPGITRRFAERVLVESTVLRCSQCGGGGRMLVLKGGKHVRMVLGLGKSMAKPVQCDACNGTGRRRVSDTERRQALGGWRAGSAGQLATWRREVNADEYARLWRRQFSIAFAQLAEFAAEPRAHLHFALHGDRVRA